MRNFAPWLISILLHLLIAAIGFFLLQAPVGEQAAGIVNIVMIGDGQQGGAKPSVNKSIRAKKSIKSQTVGSNQGTNAGTSQELGEGGDSQVLAIIRKKIERAKIYPNLALAEGLSGVARISFSLDASGKPINISIIKSTGFAVLDHEAQQAVLRAAPYPPYTSPIAFNMQFILENP